ncbi:glycosyltransferase family 2 protein [bacterium]|nr:glycosyltransferase family 2 protein [bacterium]
MNAYFNILIPVKDRAWTLKSTLETVLSQDYPHFRVIISDNCSQDHLHQILAQFSDSRLHYVSTPRPLGMSDNFEFALEHVDGDWVAYLGADDGLLPGCLTRVAELIAKTDCEAVTGAPATYLWPNLTPSSRPRLTIPLGTGHEVRELAPMRDKLVSGRLAYPHYPYLYTGGFVATRAIQKGRGKNGRFFQSIIPALYSALVLSWKLDRYVYSRRPLTLAGISSSSTGAAYFGLTNKSEVARALVEDSSVRFNPRLGPDLPHNLPLLLLDSYLWAEQQVPGMPSVQFERQLACSIASEVTLLKLKGQQRLVQCLRRLLKDPGTRPGVFAAALPKALWDFGWARAASLKRHQSTRSWDGAAGACTIAEACWVAQGILAHGESSSLFSAPLLQRTVRS